MKRVVMTAAALSGVLLGSAAMAHADCTTIVKDKTVTLAVSSKPARVTAILANPPDTVVSLSLDSSTGDHRELEWDPAVDTGAARSVTLPVSTGTQAVPWTLTLSARQKTLSSTNAVGTLKFEGDAQVPPALTSDKRGAVLHLLGTMYWTGAFSPSHDDVVRPMVTVRCSEDLVKIDEVPLAAAESESFGARGFLDGAVPKPVVEALDLLAEIAVERAKAGAMELIRTKFVTPLCTDLKLSALQLLDAGAIDGPAFPRSCTLLSTMGLADLMTAGPSLLAAARDDVRLTMLPAAARKLLGSSSRDTVQLIHIALTIANRMIDGKLSASTEIDLALELLGHLPWTFKFDLKGNTRLVTWLKKYAPTCAGAHCPSPEEELRTLDMDQLNDRLKAVWKDHRKDVEDAVSQLDTERRAACTVRLAVAVAKSCSSHSCSVGAVVDRMEHPDAYFGTSDDFPDALCWKGTTYLSLAGERRQQAIELVARVLDLRDRVATMDPKQRAVALIRWVIDVVRLTEERDDQDLRDIEDGLVALVEEDFVRAMTAGIDVAERRACGDDLTTCDVARKASKSLRLLGAVASYVRVYKETEKEDAESARAARKQALESIIDSATERSERGNDVVWSLGTTPGIAVGWLAVRETGAKPGYDMASDWPPSSVQWRLPLGIFRQTLPESGKFSYGTHLGLWVADLGQFARHDQGGTDEEIHWSDFLGVGAQAGLLFGTSSNAFLVAAEGSWAPGLYQRTATSQSGVMRTVSGAFQFGLLVSYYVPLFDLN